MKEYQKYEENRTKLLNWIATNDKIKNEAKQNFRNKGGKFLKKLWCCIGGSITR